LRIAIDDIALVIINNGYQAMQLPIQLALNSSIISQRAKNIITNLKHWQTQQPLNVQNDIVSIKVDGKSIDIFIG